MTFSPPPPALPPTPPPQRGMVRNPADGVRLSNGANKNFVYDNVMEYNTFYAIYSCEGFSISKAVLLTRNSI